MEFKNLIEVLEKQESNLRKLKTIGSQKKDILVENNYEKLNEIIAKEEQVLLAVQIAEESRLNHMQELFGTYGIKNERYKLNILVDNLKGKVDNSILNAVAGYEKRIKNLIEEFTKINHLNMVLIQQSRTLVNETIQAVINSSKKVILDRKG